MRDANPNEFQKALRQLENLPGSKIVPAVAIFIVIVYAVLSSFFLVDPDKVAIVMRLGSYNRSVGSGFRLKLPFGIEKHETIFVHRELKMEFGYGTHKGTNPFQFTDTREQANERSMITGDRNSISIEWVIQYRIENEIDYKFQIEEPEETLRDICESVMRQVIGDRSVDEALTVGRQSIADEAMEKLQKLCDDYRLGVRINQVQLKNVNPPDKVKNSFSEVNQAQQEREKMINQAKGIYNKSVPRVRGEADKRIAGAEGLALKRINEAQGDADRFEKLLTEYQKAPQITRARLYLENMQEILPKIKNKQIIDKDIKGIVPLLQLNPEPKRLLNPK